MKDNIFKPLLAPNEQIDLATLSYPLIASTKIDGIRMIVKDGKLFTRSLKPIMNINIQKRFQFLADLTKEKAIIFDGELFTHSVPFNELSGMCRGFENEIVDSLRFYCFDIIINNNFDEPYEKRNLRCSEWVANIDNPYFNNVFSIRANNKEDINYWFDVVIKEGFEGLILRSLDGRYKFGRATIKENIIYKCKPFVTFDAKIKGVIQATEVREDAEKKINELGRSVTSKKKDDRVLIDKASAFVVDYEGQELKVVIAMTDKEKEEVWKNKEQYIGKWIEYKGMLVGAKDLPRHPVYIRMREDKE